MVRRLRGITRLDSSSLSGAINFIRKLVNRNRWWTGHVSPMIGFGLRSEHFWSPAAFQLKENCLLSLSTLFETSSGSWKIKHEHFSMYLILTILPLPKGLLEVQKTKKKTLFDFFRLSHKPGRKNIRCKIAQFGTETETTFLGFVRESVSWQDEIDVIVPTSFSTKDKTSTHQERQPFLVRNLYKGQNVGFPLNHRSCKSVLDHQISDAFPSLLLCENVTRYLDPTERSCTWHCQFWWEEVRYLQWLSVFLSRISGKSSQNQVGNVQICYTTGKVRQLLRTASASLFRRCRNRSCFWCSCNGSIVYVQRHGVTKKTLPATCFAMKWNSNGKITENVQRHPVLGKQIVTQTHFCNQLMRPPFVVTPKSIQMHDSAFPAHLQFWNKERIATYRQWHTNRKWEPRGRRTKESFRDFGPVNCCSCSDGVDKFGMLFASNFLPIVSFKDPKEISYTTVLVIS